MENKKECTCKRSKHRNTLEKDALQIRLNRISGQINGIKNMIETDRYCDDILIQLVAVDKSIKSLANKLLKSHLETCVVENIKNGNEEIIDEVITLFNRFS